MNMFHAAPDLGGVGGFVRYPFGRLLPLLLDLLPLCRLGRLFPRLIGPLPMWRVRP